MSTGASVTTTRASADARIGAAPLAGVARLLVLMPSWVGDVTMSTPLLRALRTARPQMRIASLLRPGLAAILDGSSWIDERFTAPMRGAAGPWTGLRAARAFRADAVLMLPNSIRSGLASLALARIRIGYRTTGRTWTLTHACARPATIPIPAVDLYATLGEFALGEHIEDRRTELHATDAERFAATRLLDDTDASAPPPPPPDRDADRRERRWLIVNPGANRSDKRWPADRFAEAAARISREHGLHVAVTGAPSERELVASVVAGLITHGAVRAVDLVERGISLGSLKGVLQRAALLLTNDTGPRHLAAALGTPSIVLFGPTDHRWTTLASDLQQRGADARGRVDAATSSIRPDRLLLAEPFLPGDRMADRLPGVCRIERISVGDAIDAARVLLTR